MTNTPAENPVPHRFGLSVTMLMIVTACFGLGFFWVVQNNRPDPATGPRSAAVKESPTATPGADIREALPPETVPQKIPKEYNPGDTLLDLKIDRDREKSRDIETIKELLEKVGLSDKVRQEAEQELWRLTAATAKEHELESLLKAKGFRDCLVTIGGQSVTVIVGNKMNDAEVRSIGELTAENAALRLDQVRIVERMQPAR